MGTQARQNLADKQRIVIKIGSSSLTHVETGEVNLMKIEKLVRVISDLRGQGKDVVLVSSGAIAAGRQALGHHRKPDTLAEKQAFAAVGQARLMMVYQKLFAEYNQTAAQVLLTKDTMVNDSSRYNAQNTFDELLNLGTIPIVNENDTVSTSEIPYVDSFGDNDRLSAIVAALIGADLLILLSDIDGLYTDDPRENPEAGFISLVPEITPEFLRMGKDTSGSDVGTGNSVHPKVSTTGRRGYEYYNKLGYVPYDVKINENAARTLEYAYDDWCIYRMGEKLGRPAEELDVYKKRSQNYRNLFDPETKLMRGKNSDGTFQTPFNPFKWGDAFTEGNSWHYTWSVFHDVQGLVDLMGGKKMFVSMLDSVFNLPPVFDDSYYGGVIHEIREMEIANMGNYAHGNQPIQHMIYLYNYAGEPWKAQYWLRETMNRLYLPTPDGYCGDEDNGQTSAWYVFTALGFYPVCPGSNEYVMGAPYFKKATITLENGKKLEISAPKNNDDNRYIRSLNYNGKNYTKNYLNHFDLLKGGRLVFDMDNKPNKGRGINESDFPYSFSRDAK